MFGDRYTCAQQRIDRNDARLGHASFYGQVPMRLRPVIRATRPCFRCSMRVSFPDKPAVV